MRKRALALLLTAALLTGLCGCGSMQQSTDNAETVTVVADTSLPPEESEENIADTDYTTGSPWIDSNIESNVESAGDVDLKDHFDLAVNGEWVKSHQIQSGKSNIDFAGTFSDTLNERLLKIVEDDTDTEDHNAELVNTLYREFMDWEARDAAGTEPLLPYLQEIQDIRDYADLAAFTAKSDCRFADVLSPWVGIDPRDSSRYILGITSMSFFLSDAVDYEDLENMSDYSHLIYDTEKEKVEIVLTQCGYTKEEADQIYDGSIQFEKMAVKWCYDNEDANLTDTADTLNAQIYKPEKLEQYRWYGMLKDVAAAMGIKEIPVVWLYQKMDYFDHLDELLCDENIKLIKEYLLAHTASEAMQLLDKETYYKGMDFLNAINGSTGYKTDSEYAVDMVSQKLAWPLSRLYCDRYISAQDKQDIYELTEEIVDAYKEMLQEEEFLSEATKAKAVEKLDKLRINCMYPDDWSDYDYEDLELTDNYFETVMKIEQYEIEKQFSDYHGLVNKDCWVAEPIVQNAYYDLTNNAINILPGMIGDIFYSSEMPKEEVYGKMGAAIGHEISHAFDALGSSYDGDGNYVDWWTAQDKANYKEKTDRLVSYFDSLSIWDGLTCSGEMDKIEACADMGGVAVLLRLAAEDPDFDYQTFFKAFAESWAENSTPERAYYMASYDTHPVSYLRVNTTVAQFQEFYDAFDVEEGDGMYIAPENRVKIW